MNMPVLRRDLKMERVSVMDFWWDASPEASNRVTEQLKPLGLMVVKQVKRAMRWRQGENLGFWMSVLMCRSSEGYCRVVLCNQ